MGSDCLTQWKRVLVLPIILLIATAATAQAQMVWVTSASDSGPGSLRQAISDAAPGDTVRLGPELSFRTITLGSTLVIDKDLTLEGRGAPGVTISGNDAVRVFDVGNDGAACGITVVLRAVRIVHGLANGGAGSGGGVLSCASTLTVELVAFENNSASSGGALHQASGNVIVRDSAFTGNGGTVASALRAESGTLVLERVSITGNHAGVTLRLDASTAALANVTIYDNESYAGTVTVIIGAGTAVTMRNVTLASNISQSFSETYPAINNAGTLEIENSIIANQENCAGNVPVDLGGNIESGSEPCGFTSADPQLGTLGYYGSTIVQTVPIAAASPARDTGSIVSCTLDDGRKKRRALSGLNLCDSGAFEYDGPLTATVTNLNDAGAGSLRQALADIGYGGTIDFQSGLTGDITIDSTLVAPRAMTIAGPGHATLAIVRNTAAGAFRLLESGGPFCTDMAITIKGLAFRDGDANGDNGGAILNCANLSVEDARFTNNAGDLGSAIRTEGGSRLKLERVRVETPHIDSLASLYAAVNTYHVVLLDSSFEGPAGHMQFDSIHGGLLRNVTIVSPDLTPLVTQAHRTALEHVTLSGGTAFFSASSLPVSIANSILIGTSSFGGACISSGPHYESRGGNVFQGACAALAADASNVTANPQLGPFALHAPGVVKTHSLRWDSPAIDRGNPAYCLSTDARGMTRPQGATCDAGAFESHPISLAPATIPQGVAGMPYAVTFTQTGAIGAATFAIAGAGAPPPGLTLAPNGMVTGLPTAGTHVFTVTVTDETGAGAGREYTLVIDGPPAVTGLVDRSVNRNGVLGPLTFTVGDDFTNAGALTISASSSNQAIVADAGVTFGGSGTQRTLTITPIAGASGTAIITITVFDGAQTATVTFNVVVMPVYYLAEGATGDFFDLDLLIANPNSTPAPVGIAFLKEDGTTVNHPLTIAATSRVTLRVDEIEGLEATAVSSVVTSTSGLPLIVERTMRWDGSQYGAHTETATQGAAPVWYFAEGAQGFFSTYLLLANPNAQATTAHVTYFRQGDTALTRDYPVPALSRLTIDAGADPELVGRAFGSRVTFDLPGVAERAMYFGGEAVFMGGHASAGVTSPSSDWFLAEGATGSYFTTFLLLANPHAQETTATVTYLPASGAAVTRPVTIPALGRATINIALEDATLADAAVASRVESVLPIVVERSQYWPSAVWHEAHNGFGVTAAGTRWGLAEGRVDGPAAYQTYILLANAGTEAADVTVTFLRENGATLVKTFNVAPSSRYNVAIAGPGSDVPELIDESFGAVIEATRPIVVERSLYNNAGSVVWAAGTNAAATRLH